MRDKKGIFFKKNEIVPNVIVAIFLIAYIVRFFTEININYGNIVIVLVGLISFLYVIVFNKISNRILAFSFVILSFGIISMIFSKNTGVGELFLLLAYQGIAQIIMAYNINLKIFKWLYYSIIFYLFINIIIGTSPTSILNTASNNHISVILIAFLVLYYISLLRNDKKIALTPVVFALIVTLWTTGRGGIIAVGLLFIGILVLKNKNGKVKLKNPLIILSICGIIYLILNLFFYNIVIDPVIQRFAAEGTETSRFYIWRSYFELTISSLQNVFFGTPYESNNYFVIYHGNLHNTFLQVHSKYGLVILVILFYMIIQSVIYFLKHKEYYHVLFLMVLSVRSLTDFTSFPEIFDIAWYYLLFKRFVKLDSYNIRPKEIKKGVNL